MGTGCRDQTPLFLCSLSFILCTLALFCNAADTITQGRFIRDGETVVSAGQNFVLGFFSPVNSTLRYVGIWYNKIPIQTILWVANREKPISRTAGILTIGNDGNLAVFDGNGNSVWSTNVSVIESNDTTAILLDTGNLLLSSTENIGKPFKAYWQSFNNPTDTYLPGMRVPVNTSMGESRVFTSWKTASDPSPGSYSMGVDPRGSPQIVIWEQSNRRWRSGHWDGLVFTGVPSMRGLYFLGFQLSSVNGDGNSYLTYTPSNSSDMLRFQIGWDGIEEQLQWDDGIKDWRVLQLQPDDECQMYNKCGSFGICRVTDSPICSCIEGFEPRYMDQWNNGNWSGGCIRRTQLQCERSSSVNERKGDGFLEVQGVKLPDFSDSVVVSDMEECKDKCLKSCSCNAFTFQKGFGCMIWSRDLVDVERFSEGGTTLQVRLAGSELGGRSKISKLVLMLIVVSGIIILNICIWILWRFKAKQKAMSNSLRKDNDIPLFGVGTSIEFSTDFSGPDDLVGEGQEGSGPELRLYDFSCVAVATNNFSEDNKLGQGGFGPVYKGKLPGGQDIAVKKLSRKSGQGVEELKNEITLIAKLQHRNLVKLLGWCIQGEEKMLLYEYMPNKSLDCFLFDPAKKEQLDWKRRFTIIEGIARGILYIHRDSRLKIIHRDLKASNILLDDEMNPKISDFGMARIFGGNQNEANTNRVVGTFGYMSPEYAMEGLFSIKSDVYSFGVLLLEIVSGRRNNSFRMSEHLNLIGYAWHLWSEGKAMELIDPSISNSCSRNEVLRCIQVGMLCVQDSATCRPTMPAVVLMLESEVVTIPMPREPTFALVSSILESEAVSLPMPRQPIFASVSMLESEAVTLPMPRQSALTSLRSSVDMDHGIEGNDRVPHSI